MAIVLALMAMVGWATGDILITIIARKIGNHAGFFWWLVVSALLFALYIPFAGGIADYPMLLLSIPLNIFGLLGALFYFRALEEGNAALVGTIAGSYAAITVPLAMILFGDRLSAAQTVGLLAILVGIIFASLRFETLKTLRFHHVFSDKGIQLALATLGIWGVFWTLTRIPVEKIGWFWGGYTSYAFIPVLLLSGWVKKHKIPWIREKRTIVLLVITAILTSGGSFAFQRGLLLGDTALIAPIAGSSPVLFVLLSRFVFHERLTHQQKAGIILTLLGVVLMGIY